MICCAEKGALLSVSICRSRSRCCHTSAVCTAKSNRIRERSSLSAQRSRRVVECRSLGSPLERGHPSSAALYIHTPHANTHMTTTRRSWHSRWYGVVCFVCCCCCCCGVRRFFAYIHVLSAAPHYRFFVVFFLFFLLLWHDGVCVNVCIRAYVFGAAALALSLSARRRREIHNERATAVEHHHE